MKTEANVYETPKFPRLMISDTGSIVLFTAETVGTLVHQGGLTQYPVGHYCDTWSPSSFKLFNGVVKLEN